MNTYAMINKETSLVANFITWDGETKYTPPEQYFLVEITDSAVGVGWKFENDAFVNPNQEVVIEPI